MWQCLHKCLEMVDSNSSQCVRAYGAGWEGDSGALWSDSQPTQPGFQTSRQGLTNPEGDLMIFVQEGAGE